MRVLVTGSDGYIGCVLVQVLLDAGHEVHGLDCGYYADSVLAGSSVPQLPDIATTRVDLRDISQEQLAGFNAVIHLAALCNDPVGDLSSAWTHEINHLATARLARLAKEAGVRRFVFSSSCSVYGDAGTDSELTETTGPRPLTAYAVSKARSERDIAELADEEFTPVYLRNGSVYGLAPRFRADIVLNNLMCWAVATGSIAMLSDGTPWRPLVHVEDVSRVFLTVLEAPAALVRDQVFNVGVPGENYQVADLARLIVEAVPGADVVKVPHAGGDARDYRVSFAKLHATFPALGLCWTVPRGIEQLRDGLRSAGLTQEQFNGPAFTRLARLRQLIETRAVDHTLRLRRVAAMLM